MIINEISKSDNESLRDCRLLYQDNYLENLVLMGDLYDPCLKLTQVYAVYDDLENIIACFTVFDGFKHPSVVLPYNLPKVIFSIIMNFLQENFSESFGLVSFDISEKQLTEFFTVEEQLFEYCLIIESISDLKYTQNVTSKKSTPSDFSKINDFYQLMNTYAWHPSQLESGFYFFIEDSKEIIACGGTHLETPDLAQLGNIFVHEKHRRKGYGSVITAHVTREILQTKKVASLFVLQDNLSAISIYKQLGFRIFKPVSIFSLSKLNQ
ncbi:MAG: GNAT family N-acetyltransferase [Candidatus Heimdallarchaeota archaeon]|nr:GNAT family N-acetyltransferase [Candidatus Heimdallarchaeota archaeon]MCK5049835.1 GNAT family N-acetyltransferase [Candidatus Heimdallarchaeota archaeon]